MTEEETAVTQRNVEQPRDVQQPKALGLARWVQMTFVAFGLLLLGVLDKLITIIWDRFAEPRPVLVTLAAAVIATAVTVVLNRNAKIHRVVTEVIGELARVSWPSRKETQLSTIVVIVTSIIAAAIIGGFDAAWSTITDLIYKV